MGKKKTQITYLDRVKNPLNPAKKIIKYPNKKHKISNRLIQFTV